MDCKKDKQRIYLEEYFKLALTFDEKKRKISDFDEADMQERLERVCSECYTVFKGNADVLHRPCQLKNVLFIISIIITVMGIPNNTDIVRSQHRLMNQTSTTRTVVHCDIQFCLSLVLATLCARDTLSNS